MRSVSRRASTPRPGGPNPAPVPALSAPANGWTDQLFTGQASVDVNQFTGKNPPGGPLPAVWQLRQGFHAFGWNGVRAPVEFDNGFHIRSLIRVGTNFFFRTEHNFPGASLVAPLNPYAAVNPLITFTGIARRGQRPRRRGRRRGGRSGDRERHGRVQRRRPHRHLERRVGPDRCSQRRRSPVATPAVVQAGLVAGNFPVKVVDQAFPNREGTGQHPHRPGTPARAGRRARLPVPVGTLTANLTAQRCTRRPDRDLDGGRGRRRGRRHRRRRRRGRRRWRPPPCSPGPPPSPARSPSPPRTASWRTRARSCECSSCDGGRGSFLRPWVTVTRDDDGEQFGDGRGRDGWPHTPGGVQTGCWALARRWPRVLGRDRLAGAG